MSNYTPTTDEVETAFHEFASWLESTSPGEYAEAPEFADWREAMHGFRRWHIKDRAEAQVGVLREMADTLAGAEPNHLGDATEGLEYFDYGTGAEYGIDVAAAYIRNAANETARAAGIQTGEKN